MFGNGRLQILQGLSIATGVTLSLVSVNGAMAREHRGKSIDPSIVRFCVNQLLYDHTFPDGTPAGKRTIIDPGSAAYACRGVTFKDEAFAIRQCVNGLLYEETFSNGNPAGKRTIIDPASASRACAICQNHS